MLTKEAYRRLVEEDIDWLIRRGTNALVRRHIIEILRESVEAFYPPEGYVPPGLRPDNK